MSEDRSLLGLVGGLLAVGAATYAVSTLAKPNKSSGSGSGSKFRNVKQSRRVAAHEAGHALTSWALGGAVKSVTIADKDGDGHADHGLATSAELSGWHELVVLMSGIVGESFVSGRYEPKYASSDLQEAARVSDAILKANSRVSPLGSRGTTVRLETQLISGLPDDHRKVMEKAASYGRSLIRRNRSLFDEIRHELLESGEIDEEAFNAMSSKYTPILP